MVEYKKDMSCVSCPLEDGVADRVETVVRTLEIAAGRRRLTKDKLWEIFEAAAWERHEAVQKKGT